MTRQEAFNRAYLGIIAQAAPGTTEGTNGCAYYDERGLMCGIGHVVGEETAKELQQSLGELTEAFEECDGDFYLLEEYADILPDYIAADTPFYFHLQSVHDESWIKSRYKVPEFLTIYRTRMENFATARGLTLPTGSAPASGETA